MKEIPSGGRRVTMRWSRAGLGMALLVITACSSGGTAGTTEPTATSTPAPDTTTTGATPTSAGVATVVVREPDDFGPGISATTPASGWLLNTDVGGMFKGDVSADVGEAAILLWSFPTGTKFYIPDDPCQSESTLPTNPATTAYEISSALATQAMRDASEPVDVTIDGYTGKSLTVHVPDDVVFADCEGNTFLTYATGDDPGARYQQGPGQIDEIWVLDVDGSIVIIDASDRPDTRAEFIDEMRSIAESATFQVVG